MLTAIVLAPLLGAAILGLFGKRMSERLIGLLACGAAAASMLLSLYVFFAKLMALPKNELIRERLFKWIQVGSFRADASLLLDPLSGIYILFITFVGFWIHVFATGYMRGDEGYWRFFAYLNLFMFAMLLLVLADNFPLMFVGWEGVGLCSYLLIGHYFLKDFANDAAKKAFIVNRVGDFGFALGMLLLFWKAGTLFYFDDPARGLSGAFEWASGQPAEPLSVGAIFAGGLTTIAVLLLIGATGKSAQIPLYVWLPDAMAGPTPVSALIHAATMVTAGVYMVSRSSHLYVRAPAAMMMIALIGAATALLAATIGLAQWDIKKVLAYSTISQLGYMFLACGVGAFTAAIFHVFTHAFFKALLFLGSGSIIIALHHQQDMRRMGGLAGRLPITFRAMAVGWLAICGVPFLSGFFSKDQILYRSFAADLFPSPLPSLLWAVGAATAFLTAIYMTRLMALSFWGQERFTGAPHESPPSMWVPLVVLAAGAALAGYLGVPEGLSGGKLPNYFERFLGGSLADLPAKGGGHATEVALALISSAVSIAGILVGLRWFGKQPLWQPPALLERKYMVDEAYEALIVQPVKLLSDRVLWKVVDIRIIDGAVNGIAALAARVGNGLRQMQSGLARGYAAVVILGALIIIGYFVLR
jgi:NADH-quinone oxidoreductase subunit L